MDTEKPLNWEHTVSELEAWSLQHNLVAEALASAKVFVRNNEQEEIAIGLKPTIDYREIVYDFDKQSLVFKSNLPHVYIDTQIGLYLRDTRGIYYRGLEPVGHYRLITFLDGQDEDGYLIFYSAYQAQAKDVA